MEREFDQIYSEIGPAVHRYLRRVTGSRALAEDLLHETFIRLHRQIAEGVAISEPKAWLFKVATNLVRDERRSHVRSAVREEAYGSESQVIDFHAQLENQQLIRRCLDQLTPRMCQVLLLFSEGFKYKEIAEITGVEPAYVGVLIQRGRVAFKKHYQEEHGRIHGDKSNRVSL